MRQPFPLAFWSSHPSMTHYTLLTAASWDFFILKAFPPFPQTSSKGTDTSSWFRHSQSPTPHFSQTYPKVCLILYSNPQSKLTISRNNKIAEYFQSGYLMLK